MATEHQLVVVEPDEQIVAEASGDEGDVSVFGPIEFRAGQGFKGAAVEALETPEGAAPDPAVGGATEGLDPVLRKAVATVEGPEDPALGIVGNRGDRGGEGG